jgi:DNA (cytosine-5)-methyltransferase 1
MAGKAMRFGSVCSGIEAASVAWHPLGWKAAWVSEIEPFPSAVLAHHYPDVPNLGDMTTLPHRIRAGEVEAPDLLCGGTPCQAFSVAGLRKSLDDERGNLSLTFCEIANAIDVRLFAERQQPCVVFWENVPGVLSTKDNAFGCFLAGLAGEDEAFIPPGGRWTNAGFVDGPQRAVAWRVLDAQYFGVAQRRRRVFVVASARADFDPAAVLFEFDGVRRDLAPSREAGQEVAGTFTARAKSGGWGQDPNLAAGGYMQPVAPTVTNGPPFSRTGNERVEAEAIVVQPYPVANCLTARMHKGINSTLDEGQTPVVVGTDCYNGAITGDVAATIGTPGSSVNASGPTVMQAVAQVVAPALTAANNPSRSPQSSEVTQQVASVHQATMQVRRLTPVECERLQGFPDNYTAIPWRKKPASECPDGPRYKALGNSWAVPVVRWIGERIDAGLRHKQD